MDHIGYEIVCLKFTKQNGRTGKTCFESPDDSSVGEYQTPGTPGLPDDETIIKALFRQGWDMVSNFVGSHQAILTVIGMSALIAVFLWLVHRFSGTGYADDAWDAEDYILELNEAAQAAEAKARKKVRKEWKKSERKMLKQSSA